MPIPSPTISALTIVVTLSGGRLPTAAAQTGDSVPVFLRDMVSAALERELALRGARYNVAIAQTDVLGARAVFDPTLHIDADLGDQDVTGLTPQGSLAQQFDRRTVTARLIGATPLSTQYAVSVNTTFRREDPLTNQANRDELDNQVTVSLIQPLLRGVGSAAGLASLRASRRSLDATNAQLSRFTAETIAAVEQLYWLLAQREAEEAVAAHSLRRAELLLARNRQLRQLDRVTEVDLQTALLGVASRRSSLLRAQQARQDAIDDLMHLVYGAEAARLLRTATRVYRTADEPPPVPDLPPLAAAESLALQHRSDLAAARYSLESLEIFRGVTANAMLPALELRASYTESVNNTGEVRLSAARIGDIESTGWQVAVQASFPLLNSQARASHGEIASLAAQQAVAVERSENQLRHEVRQAHRGVEIGRQVLAATDSAVGFARRQYEMESQRLDLGLSDPFRLLQHEEQISEAEFGQIAARYGMALAVTRYQLATEGDLRRKYGMADRTPR